ncbi:MAG: hypothetical protein VZR64_04785 [Eubacterium sp.]|nr:hypothetical protein [Eubacterium sp.]
MPFMIFGTLEAYRSKERNPNLDIDVCFNFNRMNSTVPMLTYLNPFCGYACNVNTCDPTFDAWYENYLSNDPNAFKEFINLMRFPYNGKNVWILVDFSAEAMTNVIESLIHFIGKMYGFVCNICKEPEDTYIDLEPCFSPMGIQFFDAHLQNYLHYFGEKGLESDLQ